jgi:hypothetical protein
MRRRRVIAGVFLLMFGTFALLRMIGNPRVQALHGSDVLGLLASGLCFGAGIALLLRRIILRGE